MYDDCPEKKGTVEASVILDKIQRGERVEHDCVIVTGNLGPLTSEMHTVLVKKDLSLTLHNVTSSIQITNSIIQGKVTLEDVLFKEAVDFRGTTFAGETSFMGSLFLQGEFEGAHFQEATHFSDLKLSNPRVDKHARFIGHANFKRTVFEKYVDFSKVEFYNGAEFSTQNREESFNNRSIFNGYTYFNGVKFGRLAQFGACQFQQVEFRRATFEGSAYFRDASFNKYTNFIGSNFSEYADFNSAKFSSPNDGVSFREANFIGNRADFRNVLFNGIHANFDDTQFTGEFVSFRNANFRNISDLETAFRKAKNSLAKAGHKDEEEYHYYREMEAKRIQKGIRGNSGLGLVDCLKIETWSFWKFFFYDVLEFYFVQGIFGYGIHPFRLWFSWLVFVFLFVAIYLFGNGIDAAASQLKGNATLIDYIWFSIATAITPGYAGYKPTSDFKLMAGLEAILGTFMWAAFITTFVRKFSK